MVGLSRVAASFALVLARWSWRVILATAGREAAGLTASERGGWSRGLLVTGPVAGGG